MGKYNNKFSPIANPASPYKPSKPTSDPLEKITKNDKLVLTFLSILGAFVRLWRLDNPSSVVFDEVHFGGFSSKYISRKFFMDVHPPLAKMLFALFAYLGGSDGSFTFKEIGLDYAGTNAPYVLMRFFPAILGFLTIPLMYLTLRAYRLHAVTAALGTTLLIFENALVTQSRLILLDSPLVFGTALSIFSWSCFENQSPFTKKWYLYLALTGLSLGITASVKWVGLFTIGWVGVLTLYQLWKILGDLSISPRKYIDHFSARIMGLIVIPFVFYLIVFAVHFKVLKYSGDGDGFMSPEFSHNLIGNEIDSVFADVAYGSTVTIRHVNTNGGYLHSHLDSYPGGSNQQQITLYPHRDYNNDWVIEVDNLNVTQQQVLYSPIRNVKDGEIIRLFHAATHRRLHSHSLRPVFTEIDWQNEVSCYGYEGFQGDANDLFRVEIIKSKSKKGEARERLMPINTIFKLVHVNTGCSLFSRNSKLPEWGHGQQEVTCATQGILENSLWMIESNTHPKFDNSLPKVNYHKPTFLQKFWELQKVMWITNAGLTGSHPYDSRPDSWPLLKRGINFWGKWNRHIYLFGNPVIWWLSTAAIGLYVIIKGLTVLRWQRGYDDYASTFLQYYDHNVGNNVVGWAFHFFPFFLMQRQLFLHHYLPALYFAIIVFCQTWEVFITRILKDYKISKAFVGILIATTVVVFYIYSPLAYATNWTREGCNKSKLLDTWDFNCDLYPDSYSEYQKIDESSFSAKNMPAMTPTGETAVSTSFNNAQANVAANQAPGSIIKEEQNVEYRDQDGNIIPPDVFEQIKDKVKVETRYETSMRVADEEEAAKILEENKNKEQEEQHHEQEEQHHEQEEQQHEQEQHHEQQNEEEQREQEKKRYEEEQEQLRKQWEKQQQEEQKIEQEAKKETEAEIEYEKENPEAAPIPVEEAEVTPEANEADAVVEEANTTPEDEFDKPTPEPAETEEDVVEPTA